MINELYNLSNALEQAGIPMQSWDREYNPIPKIRKGAPCVCITVSEDEVVSISQVDEKFNKILRKYGSNQASFPCMNLAPLYRITDESTKEEIIEIGKHPEKVDDACISKMRAWCVEKNWGEKFQKKYRRCMDKIPKEDLASAAEKYKPLQVLIEETRGFTESSHLFKELEKKVWEMITHKIDISLAMNVLFFCLPQKQKEDSSYGSLSVAFDSVKLIDSGVSAISEAFVSGLNQSLLETENSKEASEKRETEDAFGVSPTVLRKPMPKVRLAGGFEVILRTMFKEHYCQTRYGKIEDRSYPISDQMRMKIKAALEWLGGSKEQENKTWVTIGDKEILFVYPSALSSVPVSYTAMFKRSQSQEIAFSDQAHRFIEELNKTKESGTDTRAKGIQIFVLRKIDNACTKIVYTKQVNPYELEKNSEEWTRGYLNLPVFRFNLQNGLYPLDVADILNCFWKQNGEIVTNKFKPFSKYHGIEILMNQDLPVNADLHKLSESAMTIGAFMGNTCARIDLTHESSKKWNLLQNRVKGMLMLMGLLLYRKNIRKDYYMDNLPYLYGQLLKAADELHALYCHVVRKDGEIPPNLVGSSLFRNAAEAPIRTMNLLSQRIMPYYSWAKSYRLKGIKESGKESWRAGWLYSICEKTMGKLQNNWKEPMQFNDEEKEASCITVGRQPLTYVEN